MFWRSFAAAALAAMTWFTGTVTAGAFSPPSSSAVQPSPDPAVKRAAEAFLRSAENLYDAAVQGDLANLQRYALETDIRMRAIPMQQIASAEGVEALARSVSRMKRAVASASVHTRDWQGAASEIRLAADALAHPDKPLWQRYRDIVMDDILRIEQALKADGLPAARARIKELRGHYGTIRTSVLLHAEPYVIERADSALRYAERVLDAAQPKRELIQSVVPALRDSVASLFPAPNAADTAVIVPSPSPGWGWPALMGSFIITILTWAGWLRYKHADPVTPRGSLPPRRRERR